MPVDKAAINANWAILSYGWAISAILRLCSNPLEQNVSTFALRSLHFSQRIRSEIINIFNALDITHSRAARALYPWSLWHSSFVRTFSLKSQAHCIRQANQNVDNRIYSPHAAWIICDCAQSTLLAVLCIESWMNVSCVFVRTNNCQLKPMFSIRMLVFRKTVSCAESKDSLWLVCLRATIRRCRNIIVWQYHAHIRCNYCALFPSLRNTSSESFCSTLDDYFECCMCADRREKMSTSVRYKSGHM